MNHLSDRARSDPVSDYLLCESRGRGEVLTNLKLQKLLYYAQAWHLVLCGSAIFTEDFQAWVHGPVLPSQYRRFKDATWKPIVSDIKCPENYELAEHLNEILDVFGSESAVALEIMTHRERPWLDARDGLPPEAASNAIITKEAMREFYSQFK